MTGYGIRPDLCMCLSEAHFDVGFSDWAARHGLGFDFDAAWAVSGPAFWTDADADLLLEHDWHYADGRLMPVSARRVQVQIRNGLAAKVLQFYGAYMSDLPPGHPKAISLRCACGITRDEDDDL